MKVFSRFVLLFLSGLLLIGCNNSSSNNSSSSSQETSSSSYHHDSGYSSQSLTSSSSLYDPDIFTIEMRDFQTYNVAYFAEQERNHFTTEVFAQVRLVCHIPESEWRDETRAIQSIAYLNDEKVDFSLSYASSSLKEVAFDLYAMEVFKESILTIYYRTKPYRIILESVEHIFREESIPTISTLNSDFSSFKEMINSLCYHEFTSPYLGTNSSYGSTSYSSYNSLYEYSHYFEEQYDTEYTNYLIDSIYYPQKMDLAFENTGSRNMSMTYMDKDDVKENADQGTIVSFSLSYGVIDPDCTNPTNPLSSLTFSAVPYSYTTSSKEVNKIISSRQHNHYYLLSTLYPEQFLKYENNDFEINIIQKGDYIFGFFTDAKYLYFVSSSIDRSLLNN